MQFFLSFEHQYSITLNAHPFPLAFVLNSIIEWPSNQISECESAVVLRALNVKIMANFLGLIHCYSLVISLRINHLIIFQ